LANSDVSYVIASQGEMTDAMGFSVRWAQRLLKGRSVLWWHWLSESRELIAHPPNLWLQDYLYYIWENMKLIQWVNIPSCNIYWHPESRLSVLVLDSTYLKSLPEPPEQTMAKAERKIITPQN
jgi:hypothetical protein